MHAGQRRRGNLVRIWTVVVGTLGVPAVAAAGDADFRLNGVDADGIPHLVEVDTDGRFVPNNGRFRDFVTQLGYVLAPRMASPAETLGHSGFHVGAIWSGSFVSGDEPYWLITERGQRTGSASSMLQTLQLDVRKGLPMSFEVGANVLWLAESEVFAPGLELRWAFQEGYRYIPDFSVRAAANHVVGNRDLSMTTFSTDIMVSKNFGVGGMVNLTPYVGWSFVLIDASSRVIDPTPNDDSDPNSNVRFDDVTFGDRLNHRLTTGLRFLYHVVNISLQGEFQLFDDYETGGSGVLTVTTKLGMDF